MSTPLKFFQHATDGRCVHTPRGVVARVGPQLVAADRPALERELGTAVPDDYWAWLLAINGGHLLWGDDECAYFWGVEKGRTIADSVEYMLAYKPADPVLDLVRENREYAGKIPSDCIVVAVPNGLGSARRLLLSCSGPREGNIIDWMPADRGKPVREFVRARTFKAFWDELRDSMPDGDED